MVLFKLNNNDTKSKKIIITWEKIIPVNIFRLVGMNVAVTFVDVEYSVFPSIKKKKNEDINW